MQLLSQLHCLDTTLHEFMTVGDVMPRLWPCFRHTLATVRRSAVSCLNALATSSSTWLTQDLLTAALNIVFQNLALETHASILAASQSLWAVLLQAGTAHLSSLPQITIEVILPAIACIDVFLRHASLWH